MSINVDALKNESLEREFKIMVPAEVFDLKTDEKVSSMAKKMQINGFRTPSINSPASAKVNRSKIAFIKRKYNLDIDREVQNEIIQESVNKISEENNLKPQSIITCQSKELKKTSHGFEFLLEFELLPEIKIPDLSKLSFEKRIVNEISQERIAKHIQEMAVNFLLDVENSSSDSKVAENDTLIVDLSVSIDDTEFEKIENLRFVVDKEHLANIFKDKLCGSAVGDEVKVNIDFEQGSAIQNFAGKSVTFNFKIKRIITPAKIEINDALAEKLGYEDVAELNQDAQKNIIEKYKYTSQMLLNKNIFTVLNNSEELNYDLPKTLLNKELFSISQDSEKMLREEILLLNIPSEEEFKNYCKRMADRRVRVGLFIDYYAKEKNITIEESEIDRAIMQEIFKNPEHGDKIVEFYKSHTNDIREHLRRSLTETKTMKHMTKKEFNIVEKVCTLEEVDDYVEQEIDELKFAFHGKIKKL